MSKCDQLELRLPSRPAHVPCSLFLMENQRLSKEVSHKLSLRGGFGPASMSCLWSIFLSTICKLEKAGSTLLAPLPLAAKRESQLSRCIGRRVLGLVV